MDIYSNDHNLQEMFALPFGVKEIANLGGSKIYGNDKLNKKFIDAMSKHRTLKPVIGNIENLIERKKVSVGWVHKNIFSLAFMRLLNNFHICAFYSMQHDRIFILMDVNVTFGFASDDVIANLLIHELMHMGQSNKPSIFKSIFFDSVVAYYDFFFQNFFETSNPKIAKQYATGALKIEGSMAKGNLISDINKLTKLFESLSEEPGLIALAQDAAKLCYTNINQYIRLTQHYPYLMNAFFKAYKNMFSYMRYEQTRFTPGQELYAPSEIAAISSSIDKNKSKYYKMIKSI